MNTEVVITEIAIGDNRLLVEVMDTPEKLTQGMMGRNCLAENSGMLFIMQASGGMDMWMKDTPIPLSIAFFDKDGLLLEILGLEPNSLEIISSSSDEVLYAIEVNKGWFHWNSVRVGDKLILKP